MRWIELKESIIGQLLSFYFRSGFPPIPRRIVIDPVNRCNLRCPLCPTGLKSLDYEPSMMKLDTLKTVLGKIPGVKKINFFNWGEPFLNPDMAALIRYAKGRGIRVCVHSNFSLNKDADFFSELAGSGLDDLILSIDGASRETYPQYRVGGDLDLVLSNIKALTEAKKRLKTRKPVITWKMIVNRYNEGEIKLARALARDLNINFRTQKMGLSDDLPDMTVGQTMEDRKKDWLPQNESFVRHFYRRTDRVPLYGWPCHHLFTTLVVNPDGKVFPCCYVTRRAHVFGDLMKQSIHEIWHNDSYLHSRSLFLHKTHPGSMKLTVCDGCHNFKKK